MMQIQIFDTYASLSKAAAEDVIQSLQEIKEPLFCPASGNSPIGLYKELVKHCHQFETNISHWYFLGLDEWIGLDQNDEGSCRNMLDNYLFSPLKIQEDHICFFDGKAKDLSGECKRIEDFIDQHGPIDLAVLGLGMNGHIGMNEPGVSPLLRSHVADLHKTTQQVGQKYFIKKQSLTKGITLGLADLMEARSLLLIVNGKQKASIVQQISEGEISEQLPATWLHDHPDFKVYLDKEAASLLNFAHLKNNIIS